MLRLTFLVAVVLLVSALAFVADAMRLPLKHHKRTYKQLQAASAQKLATIHRSLHARGLQPKGAKLGDFTPVTPMDENTAAGSYTAAIQIGTPFQSFDLVMDTGSSNLWTVDSTCSTKEYPECGASNVYRNKSSSTFINNCSVSSCSLFLPYGSGTAYGFLSEDVVAVGGAVMPKLDFGRITALPGPIDQWGGPLFDGILGLAYPIIAMPIGSMLPGPFEAMFSRGLISQKLFSVYLDHVTNSSASYVMFGGIPTDEHFAGTKVTGTMPLAQDLFGYWMLDLNGISINGQAQNVGASAYAVLDTGTTLMSVPPQYAAWLPKVNVSADCSNAHSLPDITITLGLGYGKTHDFVLPASLYVYRESFEDGSPDQCQSGFFTMDVGEGVANLYILGDTFLKAFPAVFDMANNQVTLIDKKYKQ